MLSEGELEPYLNTICWFSHYYKYVFTFIGETEDGKKVCINFGGELDDIYELDIGVNNNKVLKEGGYFSAYIIANGKIIWEDNRHGY